MDTLELTPLGRRTIVGHGDDLIPIYEVQIGSRDVATAERLADTTGLNGTTEVN